jgi:hypothetical protein
LISVSWYLLKSQTNGASAARVIATTMAIDFLNHGVLRTPRVGEFALPGHENLKLAPGNFAGAGTEIPKRDMSPLCSRHILPLTAFSFVAIFSTGIKLTL